MTSSQSRLPLAVRSFPLFSFFLFVWLGCVFLPSCVFHPLQSPQLSFPNSPPALCQRPICFSTHCEKECMSGRRRAKQWFPWQLEFSEACAIWEWGGGCARSPGPVRHCIVPDALCQVAHGSVVTMGVVNHEGQEFKFIFKHTLDCCNHSAATFTLQNLQLAYIHA